MEKSIKIFVPKGYEIDKEKSTFEEIIFKKKRSSKPHSWEEFCKDYPIPSNSYYPSLSGPIKTIDSGNHRSVGFVGYGTEEDIEAVFALLQLRSLRETWIEDWKPCYNNESKNWHIHFEYDHLVVDSSTFMRRTLSFPTEGMAREFLDTFSDLIIKAKPLL